MKKKKSSIRPPFFPSYQEGGIHVNPDNEGKFTAFAQSIGMGVQEAARHVLANKDQYSPARVKQANFARNAAGWKKQGGGAVSVEGYKRDSPDRFNAFNIIPSNQITMQGVPHPVWGMDNTGFARVMLPGADYVFPGQAVLEVPLGSSRKSYASPPKAEDASGKVRLHYQQGGSTGAAAIPPFTLDFRMREPKVVDTMVPQGAPQLVQKQALDHAIQNREILSRTPAQQAAYEKQYYANLIAQENREEDRRQRELDRREKTIERSDELQDTYSFFSPKRWTRKNLAIIAQATPERFRIFPESVGGAGEFVDDYLNPLRWVGNLAKGLGEAPLRAEQSRSIIPYFKAVGTPLVAGAVGINPASFYVNPIKGVFTSKGLTGQAQNIWKNVIESNVVDNLKDKAIEAGKEMLPLAEEGQGSPEDPLLRYGGYYSRKGYMQKGGTTAANLPFNYVPPSGDSAETFENPNGPDMARLVYLTDLANNVIASGDDEDLRKKGAKIITDYGNIPGTNAPITKLFDSIYLFNQRSDVKKLSPEQRIDLYYNKLLSDDKDVQTFKSKVKTLGYGPVTFFRNSPNIYTQDLLKNPRLQEYETQASKPANGMTQYQLGGEKSMTGFIGADNEPAFALFKGQVLPNGPIVAKQLGGSSTDTGLYPYGAINPFDVDPYSIDPASANAGQPSSAIPLSGIASRYPRITIGDPSFPQATPTQQATPTKPFIDMDTAAVFLAGQDPNLQRFFQKKRIASKDNQNPLGVHDAFAEPKKDPETKTTWGPNPRAASAMTGALSLFGSLTGAADRNRYKEQERIRRLGDNKGLLVPGDTEDIAGDYDVNSGIFRPRRYTPTQFGVAQMGGVFSNPLTQVPVLPIPQTPVLPSPEFNAPAVTEMNPVHPADIEGDTDFRRMGKDIATRTNNPGNIKWHKGLEQFGGYNSGIKGTDGGIFAGFPSIEAGLAAYQSQLFGDVDGIRKSKYYKADTPVDTALRLWSHNGYGAEIYPEIRHKTLGELTPEEREELMKRQIKKESASMYSLLKKERVFRKGGAYNVSPEELRYILANGGEVEFL